MSEDIIWDGEVGRLGNRHHVKVVRIGENLYRGVLMIFNAEEEIVYQVEVPIAQNASFKIDAGVAKEWSRVIDDWYTNKR
jgi:hypothetical protein